MSSNDLDKIKLKAAICSGTEYRGDCVTWNQINDIAAENGFNPYGTTAIGYNDYLIYWITSQIIVECFNELRAEGVIELYLVNPLWYVIDGVMPDLPLIPGKLLTSIAKDWDQSKHIEKRVFVPTLIVLNGVELPGKITQEMLYRAVGSSDTGYIEREQFRPEVSGMASEPSPVNGVGNGGSDA